MNSPGGLIGSSPFKLTIPADLSRVAEVREWVGALGRSAPLPDSRVFDLQVATSEAVANGVEHAASEVELVGWLLPDRLLVEVTNDGVFQPGLYKDHTGRRRGLGLPLMVSLADQVHVSRLSAARTKVSLTFFLEPSPEVSPAPAQEPGVLGRFSEPSAIGWLLLPVPVFILLVAIFWAVGSESAREAPVLLTIFNTLFVASASLAVAYFAGFSYRRTGSLAVLILGAGGIILGLDYLVIGALVATDLNAAVTIHNAGVLCAGLLFAASGVFALRSHAPALVGRQALRLSAGYLGALGFTVLLMLASVGGLLPDFFVEGQGYTWTRITVLALSVAAFLVATLSYFLLSRRRRSPFVILAAGSFCLFFVAFGILALTDAPAGSANSWAGRAGQWMAGAYLLAAVYSLERGGRSVFALEQSLHEVEDRYKNLIDLTPDAVLIHTGLTYRAANPAAAALLGLTSPTELIGRSVEEFLPPGTRDLSLEKIKLVVGGAITAPTEEKYLRADGIAVDVVVTRSRVMFEGQLGVQAVARDITEQTRAEEALKRTRGTLAEAQKIAHLGSFEYDAATRTTTWSEEEYRIYGLDPARPSPEYDVMLARCIHPDDAAPLHETFTKAMQNCCVYELEHRIVRPDGSVRWVYDRAHPYFDENGNLMRYVGATLDITERKWVEEQLRRSNETFANLIEHNPMGTYVIDADFKIRNASLGAQRAFTNVPPPLIGKGLDVCLRTIWPEPFATEAIGRFRHTLETGEPFVARDTVEQRHDTAEMEAYDWRLERFALPDGRFGVVCYYYDLTERQQFEQALRESEERYRALAEENERLYRQQLDIAENLQAAFLHIPSELGPVRLGHLYRSATEAARVGGDFYDVFEVKDGKIALLMGDVAGHGIEAARAATLVKDVVHAFIHQTLRTEEVLRNTNTLLIEKELPGYVTVFLAILDSETGDLRYSSAGHPDMLVRRASGVVEHLGVGSSPLGIYADAVWKPHAVELEAEDLLVLFTDGVTEVRRDGELFGEKRLETLVKSKPISAERLPEVILDEVLAFSEGKLQDDLAILTLRLTTKAEPATSKKKSHIQETLPGVMTSQKAARRKGMSQAIQVRVLPPTVVDSTTTCLRINELPVAYPVAREFPKWEHKDVN